MQGRRSIWVILLCNLFLSLTVVFSLPMEVVLGNQKEFFFSFGGPDYVNLEANANGALGSATFNLANTSTRQRWLILTADELQETTGIEAPTIEQNMSKEMREDGIYTLDGRRLNMEKAQLKPGLYIINGRKWVVK